MFILEKNPKNFQKPVEYTLPDGILSKWTGNLKAYKRSTNCNAIGHVRIPKELSQTSQKGTNTWKDIANEFYF